ncbi:TetR-family transcriptional regulator [Gottschalkia purinilytica]|uniref:TetR-family transcriptional regulator n=1 Tax=Gottschalkia purinilytica TaxID=1503 RepID=A0A0L0W9Y8_GOTPU|nr:TetR/AcrR family transcriptional regulator [Gottschalkia purinilytica]KNF08349.1 TetR-family transcriptional regulator [Gottschalkia purinilytica]
MAKQKLNCKETILNSAREIAFEKGLSNVNIRDVAKKSDIALGTVYNYFPTKGDLLASVIESFWIDARSYIYLHSDTNHDFYENIQNMYKNLSSYFYEFEKNWLNQIALIKSEDKVTGKQKMDEYLLEIQKEIIHLMDMDQNIKNHKWTEALTKEKCASFILNNFMFMINKKENNIDYFIEILKRTLQ